MWPLRFACSGLGAPLWPVSSLLAEVASLGVTWLRAGCGDSGVVGLGEELRKLEFPPSSVPCPHQGMASDSLRLP